MDESEIIEFCSSKTTLVFWNMNEYPIRDSGDGEAFDMRENIVKALHLMGFLGQMKVIVYSEKAKSVTEETDFYLSDWSVDFSVCVHQVCDITFHMIRLASTESPRHVNVVVIAKPKRELLRVMHCLKSRKHNVLLITPPDDDAYDSYQSLLANARVFGGDKKLPRHTECEHKCYTDNVYGRFYDEEGYDDGYIMGKMVDFSEPIAPLKGDFTAVFWDAEDCPFPHWWSPNDIYASISLYLQEMGFSRKIAVWAYFDDEKSSWIDDFRGEKTWLSRLYFLPSGDKALRLNRMVNDIFLWKWDTMDFAYAKRTVMVVSDQFKDATYYTKLESFSRGLENNFLLVNPTQDVNNPERPEWPDLLIGTAYHPFDAETTKSSQVPPSPKTTKSDEEPPSPIKHKS